jgi:hypothetical protein
MEPNLPFFLNVERTYMTFLQAIPEYGQLFFLGAGLVFVGVLLRKLRKAILAFRLPIPPASQPEARQS